MTRRNSFANTAMLRNYLGQWEKYLQARNSKVPEFQSRNCLEKSNNQQWPSLFGS